MFTVRRALHHARDAGGRSRSCGGSDSRGSRGAEVGGDGDEMKINSGHLLFGLLLDVLPTGIYP